MKMKPVGEKKLTLEDYVDFSISRNSIHFTIPYLNQILHMHGYRKLHKTHKRVVGEAVDALELLDLSRSTLKQTGISISSPSAYSLTLDEVVTDIEAMKWQECCLTSLHVVNSEEVSWSVSVTKPKKRAYKRRNDGDDEETATIQDLLGDSTMKMKKKKRSIRSVSGLVFD